jgi:hypothetical protein
MDSILIRILLSISIKVLQALLKRYEKMTPEQKAEIKKQWNNVNLQREPNTDR